MIVSPSSNVDQLYGYEVYIYGDDNILMARYYDDDEGHVCEESGDSWISINWIPGILDFKVMVEENTLSSNREGHIKIYDCTARYHGRIKVRQDGKI